MNQLVVSPVSTDLASRSSAALLRSQIIEQLRDTESLTLDLSNVISISESYADELFGVLVNLIGIKEFGSRISVRGASRPVILAVAHAVQRRLSEDASVYPTIQGVIAAKKTGRLSHCA